MYREILVPLDGSEFAEVALPHAIDLARAFNSRITLLYVIEPISIYPQPGIIGPVITVAGDEATEVESSREYLEGIIERLKSLNIEARYDVKEGDAASQICDYSRENNIDLIVMSTHGRSGISRWVYGSVADRVLRGAKPPVLLVRAHIPE